MENSKLERAVNLSKDVVVLVRDSAIIVLAVLLLAFPIKFNSILVEAGFEEGSVVGFKWKSKLVESNEALEKANESIASLRDENSQLLAALEEAKAQVSDSKLKDTLSDLRNKNTEITRKVDAVQSNVMDVIESNDPLIQKISLSQQKGGLKTSDYTVGLQTVGVSDNDRVELNKEILKNGYTLDSITYSYESGSRPSWFALEPTVFYYSSESRNQAESLAGLMNRLTGKLFAVRRGAGLGVDPSRKHLTFFIHYII